MTALRRTTNKDAAPHYQFDEIDRSIVALLRDNGRATNQQIAKKLDLAPATVSSRIKRMEAANALCVVAVSDFAAHGYDVLIELCIQVEKRSAAAVGEELAALPEVFAAHVVTGAHEIDLLIALHSLDELPELYGRISQIQGIRTMTPAIAVDTVKYEFDLAPLS
ncbi:Lrp/AsnC family transcriptional regulator [Sphingomonas sp. C3-2]|uniref:Lrp/AsnC family transcriptional regulator n=1 Tax=Sphingomonas sp. C3-2 TaxID=3062169 RepID=UPI00294B0435|nr:Lrp/AsnC family transcriptional regulator [Sphingomonas sp. C3-2]WOK38180.1 Lrp/AsnC family transcriptional regulator [Sphingomonas sp. C3-2]